MNENPKKNTTMKRRKLFLLITLIICNLGIKAQKIYEFNELRLIPYIDENNMKTIVFSVFELYELAKSNPEQYSSITSTDTIYEYYDTNWDGMLNKINPVIGEPYSIDKKSDLDRNKNLLFNLIFDEYGALQVPEKLKIINYRTETINNRIETKGQIAFEIPLSSEIKNNLSKIKLARSAGISTNSLTGELTPVKVLIPFDAGFGELRPREIKGNGRKKGDDIDFYTIGNFRLEEVKNLILSLLKENTELLEYKNCSFTFTLLQQEFEYSIDTNIGHSMTVSSQEKRFKEKTFTITSFVGQGRKLKK
jgi:hypothetical protein